MKWFMHDSDAHDDLKLRKVIRKFGMEGYGVFWMIVELLAVEENQIDLKKYPVNLLAEDFRVNEARFKSMLALFGQECLLDAKKLDQGVLYCPTLEKRADEYTKRVRRKSKQCSDNVPLEENTLHHNTKKTIQDIWNACPDLPAIKSWSRERNEKLITRCKSEFFLANFQEALKKIISSSFCRGKNDRTWKASLDWFLANDTNFLKALEGKYDDHEDKFAKY